MRRRSLALAAAAALAPALAVLPAAQATTAAHPAAARWAAAGRAACLHGTTPYAMSMPKLQSCGFTVSRLARVRALSGGGHAYVYYIDGAKAVIRVAPRGFRPLHASNARLREYGYPVRPHGGRALAMWTRVMERTGTGPAVHPRYLVNDPHLDNGPSSASLESSWAGNVATNHAYTNVSALYQEPTLHSSQCTNGAVSVWAGIGGAFGDVALAQSGTIDGPGTSDQAWWQILPAYNDAQPIDYQATPGQEFYTEVDWESGAYYFFWDNFAASNPANITVTSSDYDSSSAEVIAEDPTNASTGQAFTLDNFESFPVYGANASYNDDESAYGIGSLTHIDDQIVDTDDYVMGYPGATSNSGTTWTDYQRRCY